MSSPTRNAPSHTKLARPDASDGARALAAEIRRGLTATPKTLPPKLFYDARGAALFERICELPEYYLTRAELAILRAHAPAIADELGARVALVEYGSGAGTKVRLLLDALAAPVMYVPVDISAAQLAEVSEARQREYPHVRVVPVAADYTREVPLPPMPTGARRVAFFLGSTIGNFHPDEAIDFLTNVRRMVGRDGALVLGVDRRKDRETLEAAYDDAAGVTAAFNRNLLERLNREFGGTFEPSRFRHRAFFDDTHSRVEMHLVAEGAQTVDVAGTAVHFADGESIHTECSYKYDEAMLDRLARLAGFAVRRRWTDAAGRFWVVLLEAV
jgi:dimethylhistidine N-methyltransferase